MDNVNVLSGEDWDTPRRTTAERLNAAIAEAVAAERERCAKIAQAVLFDLHNRTDVSGCAAAQSIHSAIRARGE